MQSTGDDKLYLADSQIYLDFNEGNFSSPTINREEKGSDLSQYSVSPSIDVNNRIVINISKPSWDTQEEFEQRVAKILTSGDGTYIGKFKLSTISNYSGTAGLSWYYEGVNGTDIWYLDNSDPWDAHRISSYSNVDPDDHSLPIELTSFNAKVVQNFVLLKWVTESEIDNLGYNIYRRLNKDNEYQKINNEIIAGSGNSSERCEYVFKDKHIEALNTYYYKLECVDILGQSEFYGPISLTIDKTSLKPKNFALLQNYPNPFNPTTKISYSIKSSGRVSIIIYNSLGEKVKTLVQKNENPGNYSVYWDGKDEMGNQLPSGQYYYKLATENFTSSKKMILLR